MVVQALGIASAFAVLTQIRVAALMPRAVYAALAAVVGLQVRRGPAGQGSGAEGGTPAPRASMLWPRRCPRPNPALPLLLPFNPRPAGHPHRPQAQRAGGGQQGGAAHVGLLAAAAAPGGPGGRAAGAVGHLPAGVHLPAALPAHSGRRLRGDGAGGSGPPAAPRAGPVDSSQRMDRHSAVHAAARLTAGGQLHGESVAGWGGV